MNAIECGAAEPSPSAGHGRTVADCKEETEMRNGAAWRLSSRRFGPASGVVGFSASIVMCMLLQVRAVPVVTFHRPQSGETFSGRSFIIDVEVLCISGCMCLFLCSCPAPCLRVSLRRELEKDSTRIRTRENTTPAEGKLPQVNGFDLPEMGKGILLLDGGKLMEVRICLKLACMCARACAQLCTCARLRTHDLQQLPAVHRPHERHFPPWMMTGATAARDN